MDSRYAANFDTEAEPNFETDIVVIGSGNAGLRAAIEASKTRQVTIVTKSELKESNTAHAQGGIAVALSESDTVKSHVEDTLIAGDGLCDAETVELMVRDGIDRVKELMAWGAKFDQENGKLVFGIEAAHRKRRIVHAKGDATGEETENVLVKQVQQSSNIRIIEHAFAIDIITVDGRCVGISVIFPDGRIGTILSQAVILASGGLGQIYRYTSNPEVATGDGYAMAYRAGCVLTDMEFVQFHPTVMCLDGAPRFLISEAVRGEGGILINARGRRFMPDYDPRAELAPRNIVSRAVWLEMQATDTDYVYLDVTHLDPDFVKKRFPMIYKTCKEFGLDITTDLIPVQSAAHFMMGGIKTDSNASTSIPGLYACGEVACTGVHGANRLASNSLLEGLVFGRRAGEHASSFASSHPVDLSSISVSVREAIPARKIDVQAMTNQIKDITRTYAGIIRDGDPMRKALSLLSRLELRSDRVDRKSLELLNMSQVSRMILTAALCREESRGAHYRLDFPDRDDQRWRRHILIDRDSTSGEMRCRPD